MADTHVSVENGKYTFIVADDGRVSCNRFDMKDWVEFHGAGSKALIALIHHAAALEAELNAAAELPLSYGHRLPPPPPELGLILRLQSQEAGELLRALSAYFTQLASLTSPPTDPSAPKEPSHP